MTLRSIISHLKPHRTVPVVPWTAKNRWDLSLKRVLILFFGLAIFGLGDGLIIQSGLGNAPWSVLAQGISLKSGLSIGTSTLIIGALVLSLWIPLRERPGFGTIANILIISLFIEVGTNIFPKQEDLLPGLLFTLVGIAMVGIGSSLYITCGLGPGPRDGPEIAYTRAPARKSCSNRIRSLDKNACSSALVASSSFSKYKDVRRWYSVQVDSSLQSS
jgi:uncharacterized membrane protein YczE